jgi:hypothetical protein
MKTNCISLLVNIVVIIINNLIKREHSARAKITQFSDNNSKCQTHVYSLSSAHCYNFFFKFLFCSGRKCLMAVFTLNYHCAL